MKASEWIVLATGLSVIGSAIAQSSVTLYGLPDVGLKPWAIRQGSVSSLRALKCAP